MVPPPGPTVGPTPARPHPRTPCRSPESLRSRRDQVVGSFVAQRAERDVALVDHLGYFTNLTNLLAGAVLVVVGAAGLARRDVPWWLTLARGVLTETRNRG